MHDAARHCGAQVFLQDEQTLVSKEKPPNPNSACRIDPANRFITAPEALHARGKILACYPGSYRSETAVPGVFHLPGGDGITQAHMKI